jgi:hypothetical protein
MLIFRKALKDLLQEMINTYFKLYKRWVDTNLEFAEMLTKFIFKKYRPSLGFSGG